MMSTPLYIVHWNNILKPKKPHDFFCNLFTKKMEKYELLFLTNKIMPYEARLAEAGIVLLPWRVLLLTRQVLLSGWRGLLSTCRQMLLYPWRVLWLTISGVRLLTLIPLFLIHQHKNKWKSHFLHKSGPNHHWDEDHSYSYPNNSPTILRRFKPLWQWWSNVMNEIFSHFHFVGPNRGSKVGSGLPGDYWPRFSCISQGLLHHFPITLPVYQPDCNPGNLRDYRD